MPIARSNPFWISTLALILGLSACGSAGPAAVNPHPTALMTYDDCAGYCHCATSQPTVPITGLGTCICVQPDGGAPGSEASCACGGWNQAADAGTGPGGAPWDAVLWSPLAACSAYSGS